MIIARLILEIDAFCWLFHQVAHWRVVLPVLHDAGR
ncbi:hypothetical protein Q644_13215 [Brucella intermedia 229E]|uniref:Uncharacterized protein n=1 Tax=Brucella intermedia 229E TaxID=1337887 RepID=U4VAT2_9HYPH|nr:hypothetical protein Q644_13215 [Brucella intermedia 229E]